MSSDGMLEAAKAKTKQNQVLTKLKFRAQNIDQDHTGLVSEQEFRQALKNAPIDPDDVAKGIERFGVTFPKYVKYDEFFQNLEPTPRGMASTGRSTLTLRDNANMVPSSDRLRSMASSSARSNTIEPFANGRSGRSLSPRKKPMSSTPKNARKVATPRMTSTPLRNPLPTNEEKDGAFGPRSRQQTPRTPRTATATPRSRMGTGLSSRGGKGVDKEMVAGLRKAASNRLTNKYGMLSAAFRAVDKDSSGKIDRAEFEEVMGLFNFGYTGDVVDELFKECDRDGDGLVDYAEFSKHLINLDASKEQAFRTSDNKQLGHLWLGGEHGMLNTELIDARMGRNVGASGTPAANGNGTKAKKPPTPRGSTPAQVMSLDNPPRSKGTTAGSSLGPIDPNKANGMSLDQLKEAARDRINRKCTMLRHAFRGIDDDKSGYIDRQEFLSAIAAMNLNVDDSVVERLLEQADTDKDGRIDYNEFAFALKVEDANTQSGLFGERSDDAMHYLWNPFPGGGGQGILNDNIGPRHFPMREGARERV